MNNLIIESAKAEDYESILEIQSDETNKFK